MKGRAKRLDSGAKVEIIKSDRSLSPPLVVVKKSNAIIVKRNRKVSGSYSLVVDLQLSRKMAEWVREELKKKSVLTGSLREGYTARKKG